MAKVTVAGNAVIVTSSMKYEDIKFIQKYRKDALILMGGEDNKEPIFKIGVGTEGGGLINTWGAEFTGESRDEGKFAQITMICEESEDVKAAIADDIGDALTKLSKLEAQLPGVLAAIRNERQEIMDSITIAQ